jgi:MYXO-CTERM domain-containing protein
MPLLRHLAAALTLAAASSLASAAVVIDDFSDASTSSITNGGLFESTAVQAGSMIGGGRFDGLLCYFDCYYNAPYYGTLTVGGGSLNVTPPPAGLATTRVLWGNTSLNSNTFPFGSLGLNLGGESAFQLTFNSISDDLLVQFVVVSSGGQSVYGAANNPGVVLHAGGPQTLTLPFSAFVGSASFNNVAGLAVVLGGNNGAGTEAALASFSLDSVAAVPEPGSTATLAAGLLALLAVAARRRQAAQARHRAR